MNHKDAPGRAHAYGTPCPEGIVWVGPAQGGLPLMHIRNPHAECTLYLYGAHVASYRPRGQSEVLFMSPFSRFEAGLPIRGGIPLCFPWFGAHPSRADLPLHGVVRTKTWQVLSTASLSDGSTQVVLATASDEQTLAVWPHRFSIELTVTVGATLRLELVVENTGESRFEFDEAFHSYFAIDKLEQCRVDGLDGKVALDRRAGDARYRQQGSVTVEGEFVRAFMDAPDAVVLVDSAAGRKVLLKQRNMSAVVVWNPGLHAAMANAEIADSWRRFVCVESANCIDGRLSLESGYAHRSMLEIAVERAVSGS